MPASKPNCRTANRSTMSFLSPEELLSVLKTARSRSVRDWCMILLEYRHGLRASEICGLQLPDIDQKSGSITAERLKGSLKTVQPIYKHRGQPLLDEKKSAACVDEETACGWFRFRVHFAEGWQA